MSSIEMSLRAQIQGLETDLRLTKQERGMWANGYQELTKECETLRAENKQLKDEQTANFRVIVERDDLKIAYNNVTSERNRMRDKVVELTAIVDSERANADEYRDAYNGLVIERDKVKGENRLLTTTCNELGRNVASAQERIEELQMRSQSRLQKDLDDLRIAYSKSQIELNAARKENNMLSMAFRPQYSSFDNVIGKTVPPNDTARNCKCILPRSLVPTYSELQEKIKELESFLNDHSVGDALAREINILREKVKKLEADIVAGGEQWRLDLVESDKTIAYWRDKSNALRKERHELHKMVDELQKMKQPPTLAEATTHYMTELERQLFDKIVALQRCELKLDSTLKGVEKAGERYAEMERQLAERTIEAETLRVKAHGLMWKMRDLQSVISQPIYSFDWLRSCVISACKDAENRGWLK